MKAPLNWGVGTAKHWNDKRGRGLVLANSVANPEILVAGQGLRRCGDNHWAGGRARRDDRRHVGIGGNLERADCDAVKRDAGCAGQALTEDLRYRPYMSLRSNQLDEWPEALRELVNGTECVFTAH